MFAQSNFDEAKYLTLGVGAVNVAFTIVAVSIHYMHCYLFKESLNLQFAQKYEAEQLF